MQLASISLTAKILEAEGRDRRRQVELTIDAAGNVLSAEDQARESGMPYYLIHKMAEHNLIPAHEFHLWETWLMAGPDAITETSPGEMRKQAQALVRSMSRVAPSPSMLSAEFAVLQTGARFTIQFRKKSMGDVAIDAFACEVIGIQSVDLAWPSPA